MSPNPLLRREMARYWRALIGRKVTMPIGDQKHRIEIVAIAEGVGNMTGIGADTRRFIHEKREVYRENHRAGAGIKERVCGG
jgi:hypothetical protein